MAAIILFGIFFLLLFMNMPIAFALGISSLAVILFEGLPLMPIASNLYAATSKFVLLAYPSSSWAATSWTRAASPPSS